MTQGQHGWQPAMRPDQHRFDPPPPQEERRRRRVPVRGLVWGALGIVLLGVAIGTVYVNYFRPVVIDPDTIVRPPAAPTDRPPPITAQTPQEIVEEYFTALAGGDVARALAMGMSAGDGSHALLSRDVVNRARELLPITDVEVLPQGASATEIPVRYLLGGAPHETMMQLVLLDTGEYQLARTTVTAQFALPGGQHLPLLVNGQEIDPTQPYELLPGRYEITTGLPFIGYTAASSVEVPDLRQEEPLTANVTPALTEAGAAALIDEARASLNACIERRQLSPEGCPNQAAAQHLSGVDESTVRWRLANDPWLEANPTLTAEDQSVALLRVPLTTTLSFSYHDGGSSTGEPTTRPAEVRASMLGDDPAAIEITWAVG